MWTCPAFLENSMNTPQKNRNWSSRNSTFLYIAQVQKHDVEQEICSIFTGSQCTTDKKLETIQVPMNTKLQNETMVYNGIHDIHGIQWHSTWS